MLICGILPFVMKETKSKEASEYEADSLDSSLVDMVRKRSQTSQSLARLLFRVKRDKSYKELGYGSMRKYLKARGIGYSQGVRLARIYEVLSGLGLSEQEWADIKLSKLSCCIGMLNRENVAQILSWARTLSRRELDDRIHDMRGTRPKVTAGHYRMVPCPAENRGSRLRSVRGDIYVADSGEYVLTIV